MCSVCLCSLLPVHILMCVYVSEKERERERARAVPGPEALVTQSYLCERVCVRVSA